MSASTASNIYYQDIELVINDADQRKAFRKLTFQRATPVVPNVTTHSDFERWGKLWGALGATSAQHNIHDRCKNYLCTPIYRLRGERNQFAFQFIILYSAESLRLPPVPDLDAESLPSALSHQPYVELSAQPEFIPPLTPAMEQQRCLIPTFSNLLGSEIHVILQHTKPGTPPSSHHLHQLVELITSRSYSHSSIKGFANPIMSELVRWLMSDMRNQLKGIDLLSMGNNVIEGNLSLGDLTLGSLLLDNLFDFTQEYMWHTTHPENSARNSRRLSAFRRSLTLPSPPM